MPRNEYPKSRRILMQAVMCLIFGATVGLAAFVTQHRRFAGNSHLAPIKYAGNVGVQLPKGWFIDRQNQGLILFLAVEPDTEGKKGRKITIRKHKLDSVVSPEEFLQSSGLLRGTLRIDDDPSSSATTPITVAGYPGVMLPVKRPLGFLFLPSSVAETVWFGASVRPSAMAISLELQCPDDSDPEGDQTLLEDIAAAMDVRDSGK